MEKGNGKINFAGALTLWVSSLNSWPDCGWANIACPRKAFHQMGHDCKCDLNVYRSEMLHKSKLHSPTNDYNATDTIVDESVEDQLVKMDHHKSQMFEQVKLKTQ